MRKAMSFFYDFEPPQGARLLNLERTQAEITLKRILDVASRVPGIRPPAAVILYQRGKEIWRWSQADRVIAPDPASQNQDPIAPIFREGDAER